MKPDQCKHEWEVASAVEAWEEQMRLLEEEDKRMGLRVDWPDIYKMTAIKCILLGNIKKDVELREQ